MTQTKMITKTQASKASWLSVARINCLILLDAIQFNPKTEKISADSLYAFLEKYPRFRRFPEDVDLTLPVDKLPKVMLNDNKRDLSQEWLRVLDDYPHYTPVGDTMSTAEAMLVFHLEDDRLLRENKAITDKYRKVEDGVLLYSTAAITDDDVLREFDRIGLRRRLIPNFKPKTEREVQAPVYPAPQVAGAIPIGLKIQNPLMQPEEGIRIGIALAEIINVLGEVDYRRQIKLMDRSLRQHKEIKIESNVDLVNRFIPSLATALNSMLSK